MENATFEQRCEIYLTHRLCAILRSLGKNDLVSLVDGLSALAKCDSIVQHCEDNRLSVPSDMNVFFGAALMESIAHHQSISIDVADRSVETALIRPLHDFQRTIEYKVFEKAMDEDYFIDWRTTRTYYLGDSLSFNYGGAEKTKNNRTCSI